VNSEPTVLEVDDAVVLLLGAPSKVPTLRNRVDGITRLEKLVFLLERETPLGEELSEKPDFESHNFGPFSSKIYQAVDTLVAAGLLEDSAAIASSTEDAWEAENLIGTSLSDPYATRNFSLTDKGQRYYKALIKELPSDTEVVLERFKERFGTLPLRQLIRYVYQRYPGYTDKSVIRRDILGDRGS
jgi:uncharacterized protein